MVIVGLQAIIGGIFLGNFVGPNAMASVNIAIPFMESIVGFSMVISVGSLSFIGRNLGASKKEESQNAFKTSFISITLIGLVITLVGVLFNKEIGVSLGANDVLLEGTSTYIKYIALFAPIICLMHLFGFVNRVVGKPELYLWGTILSVIVNISLNFLFIVKLNLGIRGTALANGLSYFAAFLVAVRPILNKNTTVNIFSGKFDKSVIIPIVYNGSSEAIVSISVALTAYLFNITFMKTAGEAGVVAFTAINYIGQFGILIMFGISDGVGVIISYNYGNKQYNRVDKTLKLASKINLAIGIILFLILFIFGEQLILLFTNTNNNILDFAVRGSKIYAFSFLVCGFNIINSGYFTAIGDAKSSIVISLSRGIVFVILGINILPMFIGIDGIWLTIPFAELMSLIIGIHLIKKKI
jgi:putative MATE family efflux protein